MNWLAEFAAHVVWTSVICAAMAMATLAYFSTGAPAARHELYELTSTETRRINRGAVTRRKVAIAGAVGVARSVVSLNPLRCTDDGRVSWARGITRAETENKEARHAIYSLLAVTKTGDPEAVTRLQQREHHLIA